MDEAILRRKIKEWTRKTLDIFDSENKKRVKELEEENRKLREELTGICKGKILHLLQQLFDQQLVNFKYEAWPMYMCDDATRNKLGGLV